MSSIDSWDSATDALRAKAVDLGAFHDPLAGDTTKKKFSVRDLTEPLRSKTLAFSHRRSIQEGSVLEHFVRLAVTRLAQEERVISIGMANATGPVPVTWNVGQKVLLVSDVTLIFEGGAILSYAREQGAPMVALKIQAPREDLLNDLINRIDYSIHNENHLRGKIVAGRSFLGSDLEFLPLPAVTFNDVILDPIVKEDFIRNTTSFLRNPKMKEITSRIGVLLEGPPGTGKTSLVEAAANDVHGHDITTVVFSGDDFLLMSANSPVPMVMEFIREYLTPALIVFEDVDLIAADRDSPRASRSVLGSLLSWLNGMENRDGQMAIVMTTNRIDALDEAITRPCRVDRRYPVPRPTMEQLAQIWDRKGGGIPLPPLSVTNPTGAHITDLLRTAKMFQQESGDSWEECVSRAAGVVSNAFHVFESAVGFKPGTDDGTRAYENILGVDYAQVGGHTVISTRAPGFGPRRRAP